jgi:MinD superfamily P-loop ATPase
MTCYGEDMTVLWAEIDWDLCQGCNPCEARRVCKTRAIVKFSADELAFVDRDRCRGCGVCLPACGFLAVHLNNPQNGGSQLAGVD